MSKKMNKKWLVVANLIICLSMTGFSQEKGKNTFAWLNAGLGYSSLGSLGAVGSLNIQYKRILFALRGTANTERLFEGDELLDLGLLIGYVSRSPKMIVSVSTGVARVTGSYYFNEPAGFFGGHREPTSPVLGIPLDVQIIARLGRYIGLGAYIYANINSEKNFFGIAASIVAMGGYPD